MDGCVDGCMDGYVDGCTEVERDDWIDKTSSYHGVKDTGH
jgi:hypothetical protein